MIPYAKKQDRKCCYRNSRIKFKSNYFNSHFIDIEGKYGITFNRDEFFYTFSILANFYFTRFMGLTYRFKFSQLSDGTETYN